MVYRSWLLVEVAGVWSSGDVWKLETGSVRKLVFGVALKLEICMGWKLALSAPLKLELCAVLELEFSAALELVFEHSVPRGSEGPVARVSSLLPPAPSTYRNMPLGRPESLMLREERTRRRREGSSKATVV